jgi:hypothetical protein
MRRRRGRPKGSTVPIELDRQKYAVALWRAFREFDFGPYKAGYLAATVVSNEPIRLEDVEGLLVVASTEIKRTASSLDKHVDALVRKAKRVPDDNWLAASATAIKALVLAIRSNKTATACGMLDVLVALGWHDLLSRLTARINDALRSNIPPRDGKPGHHGHEVLGLLKKVTSKKA